MLHFRAEDQTTLPTPKSPTEDPASDDLGFLGTLTFEAEGTDLSICEVTFPARMEFDTHEHAHTSTCLIVEGSYEEWSGASRRVLGAGEVVEYVESSRHAVATGPTDVRILRVTDTSGAAGSSLPSPIQYGMLWQISREIDRGDPLDDAALLHLETLVAEFAGRSLQAEPPWLRKSFHLLQDSYRSRVSISDLAANACVGRSHFAKAFKQVYGMSAGGFPPCGSRIVSEIPLTLTVPSVATTRAAPKSEFCPADLRLGPSWATG